jgi:hypothetical protein
MRAPKFDDLSHGRIGRDEYDEAQRRKESATATVIAGLILGGLVVLGFYCLVVPS